MSKSMLKHARTAAQKAATRRWQAAGAAKRALSKKSLTSRLARLKQRAVAARLRMSKFTIDTEMYGRSLGHTLHSADIRDHSGKLVGGMTFSVSPSGVAKIGKISAFKGPNAIGLRGLLKLRTDLVKKVPQIKSFAGDRVGKHLKGV